MNARWAWCQLNPRSSPPPLTWRNTVGATAQLSQLAEQFLPLLKQASEQPSEAPPPPPEPFEPGVRWLSPDQNEEIVACYQAGEPIADLAERLGIHRGTIYHRLQQAGIILRPRQALTPTQVGVAARLYGKGQSLVKVGRQLGVDAQTVRNHLAKAGVEIRKRRGWE
jgi:DNA-binding CsgD family transcriptional regulator